jgi:MFS superfamily sulfate permease-like transporter
MSIDWTYIQENYDWLGHMVEALVIALVVALISRVLYRWRISLVIGLAFAMGHFHGREKRDYEVSVHMPPPHLDGYRMWDWSWDQMTDFWPTAFLLMALLFLVIRRKA